MKKLRGNLMRKQTEEFQRNAAMRLGGRLLAVLAVALTLPLCASAQLLDQPQTTPLTTNIAHRLQISSGDLLEVGVFDTPELSGKLRVNEAGEIVIPVAGALRVEGMTAEEAAASVEQQLLAAEILKDPHVSIFIVEYATQGVTVTGEVKSPGIYPLLGSHGLVDLLSAAGGVTSSAGRMVSVTHKSDPTIPRWSAWTAGRARSLRMSMWSRETRLWFRARELPTSWAMSAIRGAS